MSYKYTLLRRTLNVAREGWSTQVNALPEVASEVVTDWSSLPGFATPAPQQAPANKPAVPSATALAAAPGLSQRLIAPTLGQWSKPVPRLPTSSLQKPLAQALAMGMPTGLGMEVSKAWPPLAPTASPAAIAAATVPGMGSLLRVPLPASLGSTDATGEATAVEAEAAKDEAATAAGSSSVPAALATAEPSRSGSPQSAQGVPPPPPPPPPVPSGSRRSLRTSSGGPVSGGGSVQLNKQIMACRSTEELLSLVQMRGASFDFFNISSAIARVPKLAAVPPGMGFAAAPAVAAASNASGASAAAPGDAVHLDQAGRALLDHLARLMCASIHTFDARGIANSAWAFGKLKYTPSAQLPTVIAAAALARLHEFSPQNMSNMMWSFVYMHHRDPQLLAAVAQQVVGRVPEFKPQELANIVWAFASLDYRDDRMLAAVASHAQRIAPLFKEQELSNMIWAYGKLHAYHGALLDALMAETRAKLPAFLPQGVSNVAWALASVGHRDQPFLDQVVAQCGRQLGAFDVQALSNLAWAMASLGYYQPAFFGAMVDECLSRGLERLSPQNLSNILWSCATLGHHDARMLSAWAAQTLEKLTAFEPQGLSNSAWAFARLGYSSSVLFEALAAASLHRLEQFSAQGLSNLAWAFASAGQVHAPLFEALARAAAAGSAAFNAQNCSMMLWACATLRHYDGPLFDAMLGRLALDAGACEPQNVANALWAVARVGHPLPADAARPLLAEALRLLPAMNQQELCNTFWALAVLELLDVDTFNAFCGYLARVAGEVTAEGMHQAYHAQLMFHSWLARSAGVPLAQLPPVLLPRLPEPLHGVAAALWQASARDVHVSRFHQEVSGALAMAGVPHAVEWLTDDANFSIDIGLEVNTLGVAVEVDGSHHFTTNEPLRAMSDQAVRRRLLQDRGWAVVNVGFRDWDLMGTSLPDRASTLLARIAAAVGTWDWRSVNMPLRRGLGSASGAAAAPPAPAVDAALSAMACAPQSALQQALTALGVGPAVLLPLLAGLEATSPLPSAPATPARDDVAAEAASAARTLERSGSLWSEGHVEQALAAAEALHALPDGDKLLAQQALSVLGVKLAPLDSNAYDMLHAGDDDHEVDVDSIERVVQFALA